MSLVIWIFLVIISKYAKIECIIFDDLSQYSSGIGSVYCFVGVNKWAIF
jgi:hypothetical protein